MKQEPIAKIITSGGGGTGVWSAEEHDRFLEALKMYPHGPWRAITEHIGTRSIRQVQTHAQKYQEKIARRLRGVPKEKKHRLRQEHRIDHDVLQRRTLISVPTVNLSSLTSSPRNTLTDDYYADGCGERLSDLSAMIDDSDLPTLSESLDFFIKCFTLESV